MIRINVATGIQVAGHRFAVKTGQHINERLQEGKFYGRYLHKEKEILIDNSLSECMVSNHIIHEILHAVDAAFCNSSLRENQIVQLANGIHQVVEDLGIRFVIFVIKEKEE